MVNLFQFKTDLISGIFQDTIHFDNQKVGTQAYSGGYLAKVDKQGTVVWMNKIGGLARISNLLLTSGSYGEIYSAGVFADSLQLGDEELAITGEKGIFLTQILPNGNTANPLVLKCSGQITLGGIASSDSLICLAGSFRDTLQIQDTVLVSFGEEDIFIAMFSKNGELKKLIICEGQGHKQVKSVAFTSNSTIAATGNFENTILIQDHLLQSNGGKDIFVISADTSGILHWIKKIGGISDDLGYSVTSDQDKNIFISGNFTHSLTMPDEIGNLVEWDANNAFGNAFIAKYNQEGELKASYDIPASSEDYCQNIIVDSLGNITVTGNFYHTILLHDTDGQDVELISDGERDIFLMRFNDMCRGFYVDAGNDTTICPQQSIILEPAGEFTYYRWVPDGLPDQPLVVTQPGVYKLLVTDEYGCIARDSLQVVLNYSPTSYSGNDTILDAGENLLLNKAIVTDANSLVWTSNGSGYFTNPYELQTTYTPSNNDIINGIVQITLTSANHCGTNSSSFILSIDQDDDGITAFPNPTDGIITLVCTQNNDILTASITTQAGNVVQANIVVNGPILQYDLSSLPPGTYLFHLLTATQTVTKIINKI